MKRFLILPFKLVGDNNLLLIGVLLLEWEKFYLLIYCILLSKYFLLLSYVSLDNYRLDYYKL
jgi:hypothetical protein